MSYTFDCVNKIIQLNSSAALDMIDLYSRWKDEVLSSISECIQPLRVVKEPLAGSSFIGPYYFIMNNWQIRPYDIPHELVVVGTVVQDSSSSLDPFKLDNLTSVVSIVRQVAVDVQVIETGGSSLTAEQSTQLMSLPNKTEIAQEVIKDFAF